MIRRFVHLSDIHFGQERQGTNVVHEDVRAQLLHDVAGLAAKRGNADRILVVGDIAYAGKPEQYRLAGEWLDKLAQAVGCKETDVRVVPGNHDCDRSQVRLPCSEMHKRIRNGTPKSAYADLEALAADDANPLLPKLKAYRDFAASYSCDFESALRPLWQEDIQLADGVTLRVVGMCSVQVCDSDDRSGAMILGSTQYILPVAPNVIYLALMHHPLDWYMDKLEAKPYLQSRARLIMVGHEHIAEIDKVVNVLGEERLVVYAGATNPPEATHLYVHTYNWLELELTEHASVPSLSVTIFPRVWAPQRAEFCPDIARLKGQESARLAIACPGVATHDRVSDPAGATALADAHVPAESGDTMVSTDDTSFATLKLFFWRYLDWRQRLTVLVQADVLPSSADRPVPQTLEQLALDRARRLGRLAIIWDAVMTYVPSDRRKANPFTGSRSHA